MRVFEIRVGGLRRRKEREREEGGLLMIYGATTEPQGRDPLMSLAPTFNIIAQEIGALPHIAQQKSTTKFLYIHAVTPHTTNIC
jgi:hypothetical protein